MGQVLSCEMDTRDDAPSLDMDYDPEIFKKCKVCFRKFSADFLPVLLICGHLVSQDECLFFNKSCPICGKPTEVRMFNYEGFESLYQEHCDMEDRRLDNFLIDIWEKDYEQFSQMRKQIEKIKQKRKKIPQILNIWTACQQKNMLQLFNIMRKTGAFNSQWSQLIFRTINNQRFLEQNYKSYQKILSMLYLYWVPSDKMLINNFLVIKGQGVKTTRWLIEDIKMKKIQEMLNLIEKRNDWDKFALMIDDFILRPNEKIEKLTNLFSNSRMIYRNIAATIITEGQMFELQQQKIKEMGKVDFEKIVVRNKGNEKLKNSYLSKIQKIAEQTSHDQFKNQEERIKPILLLTSELWVTSSINNNKKTVHCAINSFLSQQNFTLRRENSYKQNWEYNFTSELIQQLRRISPSVRKGKGQQLWRSVHQNFGFEVGQILTFKQFLSTSSKQKVALQFAYSHLLKIVSSHSSKCIKEFSYNGNEAEEYLFEPYTQFKIIETYRRQGLFDEEIIVVVVQEEPKLQIERDTGLILLWVDHKIRECRRIWRSLQEIHRTAVMVQLMTTEDLVIWLKKNKEVAASSSIEIVMITNMVRYENEQIVDEAGVEAIDLFHQQIRDGPICLYNNQMKQIPNRLKLKENLHVAHNQQEIRNFLRRFDLK